MTASRRKTQGQKSKAGVASALAARTSMTSDQAARVSEATAEQAPDRPITGAGDSPALWEWPLSAYLAAEAIRAAAQDARSELIGR